MLPISIGAIISLVTGLGPTVSAIGKQIVGYKIAKDNTESVREKNKIDQQISEAHDRRDIVVAEAGNRVAVVLKGIMRAAIAAGPVSYLLKISLYDKVIGSFYGCTGRIVANYCDTFRTDAVDTHIWVIFGGIVAFYFAYDMYSISRKS